MRCSPLWRVESGVQNEDRVARGEIAHRARHRLWMNAIAAAIHVRLLVEHRVPATALGVYFLEKHAVGLGRDAVDEQLQCRPNRAQDSQLRRSPSPEHLGALIDLHHFRPVGQKLRVRIVSAEHQEEIALHHRVVTGLRADHADATDPARVVIGQDVLPLDGMNEWRFEAIRKGFELRGCAATAGAAHDRNAPGRVDALARLGNRLLGGHHLGQRPECCNAGDAGFRLRLEHVLRTRQMRHTAAGIRGTDCLMDELCGLHCRRDGLGVQRDVTKEQIGLGRLNVVGAVKLEWHVARKREHRRVIPARFIEPGDQVRAPRARRSAAHAQSSRQLGLACSSESGAFLVTHANPLDLAVPHRVRERIERVPDQSEYVADADPLQRTDQQFRYGSGHTRLRADCAPCCHVKVRDEPSVTVSRSRTCAEGPWVARDFNSSPSSRLDARAAAEMQESRYASLAAAAWRESPGRAGVGRGRTTCQACASTRFRSAVAPGTSQDPSHESGPGAIPGRPMRAR